MNNKLTALTSLDGRYSEKTQAFAPVFSEFGLFRYRVHVECQWLQFLSKELQLFDLGESQIGVIDQISKNFNIEDAQAIKDIEATTNHDVKAVEYFIKNQLDKNNLSSIKEWVHFACTSEDINNLSYCLMIKEGRALLLEQFNQLLSIVESKAKEYKSIPMMARTHGQPASPTTVGKEFVNFAYRIKDELAVLDTIPVEGKINGATGNFNAHQVAFKNVNWIAKSEQFITNYLGISNLAFTTQINPYSYISRIMHSFVRLAAIVTDLDKDIWTYISLNYLKQKLKDGEIGSSTMPHKVNPIDFENAEGNFGLAIAIAEHMAVKLLNSRLQRDLTDSTVLRNIGSIFGYLTIGIQSTIKGLNKIDINEDVIQQDLALNVELLAEPVQTVMRVYQEENPYEKLKQLTRGQKINLQDLSAFIDSLSSLPDDVKADLKALTPATYVGLAEQLVDHYFNSNA